MKNIDFREYGLDTGADMVLVRVLADQVRLFASVVPLVVVNEVGKARVNARARSL